MALVTKNPAKARYTISLRVATSLSLVVISLLRRSPR
jgi:hypothetical protein